MSEYVCSAGHNVSAGEVLPGGRCPVCYRLMHDPYRQHEDEVQEEEEARDES